MIVKLKKHHLQYFRNKAKKSNNEIYAFLIGTRISPTLVEIVKFKYPSLTVSTPTLVIVDIDDECNIEDEAKLNNWTILGSIHSHPNYITAMSGCDVETLRKSSHSISGIVGIINNRTFVNFWTKDSPLAATIQYV